MHARSSVAGALVLPECRSRAVPKKSRHAVEARTGPGRAGRTLGRDPGRPHRPEADDDRSARRGPWPGRSPPCACRSGRIGRLAHDRAQPQGHPGARRRRCFASSSRRTSTTSPRRRTQRRLREVAAGRAAQRPPRMTTVEHVMGMGIIVDVRDDGRRGGRRRPRLRLAALRGRDVLDVQAGERDLPHRPRRALGGRRSSAGAGGARAVRGASRRDGRLLRREGGRQARPVRPRQGLGGRRAAAILERGGARNFAVYAGGDVIVRGRPEPGDCWHVGHQASRARGPDGGRRRGHRPRRRDVRRVCPRRSRARPAHGPASLRPPLGDDHRPGARDGRRVRDGGLRHGRAGPAWTAQLDGYEAISILESETVLSTPGFPALD